MSLEHFWGKTGIEMSKTNSKKNDKKTPASIRTAQLATSSKQDGAEPRSSENEPDEQPLTKQMLNQAMATLTTNLLAMIESKLDTFLRRVDSIAEDLKETNARVGEAENRISTIEDGEQIKDDTIAELVKDMAALKERLDDQEDRGRRKNIRIVGLPESVEGTSPILFMESWIPGVLNMTTKAGKIKLERAYRVGRAPVAGDESGTRGRRAARGETEDAGVRKQYPRVMIVKVHNYADRVKVLDSSRRAGEVKLDGRRIFFFQDFSNGTMTRRRAFDKVRKKLQTIGMRNYGLIYPATFRITVNGKTKSFDEPDEAMAFVNTLQQRQSDDNTG